MLEERYHKTWPLPLTCRFMHRWVDKDESHPRHFRRSGTRIYVYEQCSRCGARQVVRVMFGLHSPYDHKWVLYQNKD